MARYSSDEFSKVDENSENKNRRSLKPLRALVPFVLRYKPLICAALVALVVAAGATLAIPLALRGMIDNGFTAINSSSINSYFLAMLTVAIVLAIASSSRYYFVTTLGERVVNDVRRSVFEHIISVSPQYFDANHSAEITSRLTADTTQIKAAVGASMSIALRNGFLLVGAVIMMIITSAKLSGLVLVAIPLIVLPLIMFGRRVRAKSRSAQDALADAASFATEHIEGVRTVQAFGNENHVSYKFADTVDEAFLLARSNVRARAILTASAILMVFASVVGVLWWGAQEVLDGSLSGGELGQFVLYSVFAAGAMGELSQVWGEVQQAAGAAERLSELLNVESKVTDPENPMPLPNPFRGEIKFDNVSFSYPTRSDLSVLHGLTATIKSGQTIAIVGPSGGGKSTMFQLLLRAYDPVEGMIMLDGTDISAITLKDLRSKIAYVPQDAVVFATTIAENIRFGRPGASMEDIKQAAKAAHADEFIERLPDTYNTRIGERGVTLSGGQRQRLAIARAILRDAPILLLDEATSALDAESETAVQAAIDEIKKGRTTLVIAHRLSTIRAADNILVMDQGRLVEQGSHEDLRKKEGLYARLAELQFGEIIEA